MAQRTSPGMIEIPDGVTHVALESWERGTSERERLTPGSKPGHEKRPPR